MTDHFPGLDAQVWIARKLGRPDLFAGVTDNIERRERIRNEIVARGIDDEIVGKRNGIQESWRMVYRRIYGEEL